MAFATPGFLWALTALAIPILIHLFQLRRFKRLDFPNVHLLKDLSERSRARRKLRHLAVLLARCAALAFLVLAFARPYLPGRDPGPADGARTIALYIDNSFSMDGENANGRLLDQARAMASDVISTYDPKVRFQVMDGTFEGRQQLLLGQEDALDAASQVVTGPQVRPLSQVITRMGGTLAGSGEAPERLVIFTDLQRSITDPDQWATDTTREVTLVPITPQDRGNLSLDTAWFSTPVRRTLQQETLHVGITNHGDHDLVGVPIRFTLNGAERAVATVSLPAGSRVDTTLFFRNDAVGPTYGVVSIMDAPIRFDDELVLAWQTSSTMDVLLITENEAQPSASDRAIEAVFTADSLTRLIRSASRNVDLTRLPGVDLVVLNGIKDIPSGLTTALASFVEAGGSLALFPATGQDPGTLRPALVALDLGDMVKGDTSAVKVDRIDLTRPFYRDVFGTVPRNVDLPLVREHLRLRPPPGTEVLLRLQDGDPFLVSRSKGAGKAYLCAAPLSSEGGNFTRHALFVTSLLRMAELSRPMGRPYHSLGELGPILLDTLLPRSDRPVHLLGPGGLDLIPELRPMPGRTGLLLHDEDLPPGPYAVTVEEDTLQLLALNVDRRESDLDFWTPEALRSELSARGLTHVQVAGTDIGDRLSIDLRQADEGTPLWRWCILAALVFLALETIFLRPIRTG